MTKQPLRICSKCGRGHFPVTREFAEQDMHQFGEYILAQPAEIQADYGFGPLSPAQRDWSPAWHVSQYEHCCQCGNTCTDFRDATPSDKKSISPLAELHGIIVDARANLEIAAQEVRYPAPPAGYATWLDYAVATMDTRSVELERLLDDGPAGELVPTREEMRLAVRAELDTLRQHALLSACRSLC